MNKPFLPQDWYWVADDGRVYASGRGETVGKDDAAFAAWAASGGLATRWPGDDAGAQTDAALQAVLTPYGLTMPGQTAIPPPLGFLAFLALFTPAEQGAIVASEDPSIKLFCLLAAGATEVSLSDPRTVAGTQKLEALGLIAKGRAAQVLAGQAPKAAA